MDVILLTKVANLGNIGDRVKVKSGYGRNSLERFVIEKSEEFDLSQMGFQTCVSILLIELVTKLSVPP